MVKLRLKRLGKKHEPHYRLVVIHARTKRDSKAIEEVGLYNPLSKGEKVTLKVDRIKYWLSVGAQPTDTVRDMLIRAKLLPRYEKKFVEKKDEVKKVETEEVKTVEEKKEVTAEAK